MNRICGGIGNVVSYWYYYSTLLYVCVYNIILVDCFVSFGGWTLTSLRLPVENRRCLVWLSSELWIGLWIRSRPVLLRFLLIFSFAGLKTLRKLPGNAYSLYFSFSSCLVAEKILEKWKRWKEKKWEWKFVWNGFCFRVVDIHLLDLFLAVW